MCSAEILISNSCYLDNWVNITHSLSAGLVMGAFLGVTVGIILLFLKK
jgi:hypothetical protein